ncbi:MAG: metallophosphoesterase [Anaerolineaceae bacterium]|nr:metallophosphoesterase [Anaerolineaceae bacterium]
MNRPIQIALIGDVHRQFDQHDITQFNQSNYDLLLCTGDLSNRWHWEGMAVAPQMARLQKPTLLIPGNHDTLTLPQLVAEIKQWPRLCRWLAWGQPRRLRQWQRALGPVQVGGYSGHPVPGADDVAVLVGRPFAMGGSVLHCQPQLQRQFGIGTMADSAARLCQLVEQTPQQKLIFLAHNGPTGLGRRRDSIWGNDFHPDEGILAIPICGRQLSLPGSRAKRCWRWWRGTCITISAEKAIVPGIWCRTASITSTLLAYREFLSGTAVPSTTTSASLSTATR